MTSQVYKAVRVEQNVLEVTILRGRHISQGWIKDRLDTPDPFVQVVVPGTVKEMEQTRVIDNNTKPEWNETFTFHLHPIKRPINIVIRLMESNYTKDSKVGEKVIDISELAVADCMRETLVFPHKSEVDIEITIRKDDAPTSDMRFGNALSEEEHMFRNLRSRRVMAAMKELLGEAGPTKLDEVPCIAILGSGGGYRAMTALTGIMKALADTNILDCTTYFAGLSGSTWYMSSLYSHPRFPDTGSLALVQEELREMAGQSLAKTLWSTPKYLSKLKKKCDAGLPVAFTDLFGFLVGSILLKHRQKTKLSDQRVKIEDAAVPMPLYSCINVKDNESATTFHDWMELSPNEVSLPKYGISIDTKHFNNKFYRGKIVEPKFEEPPLSYLQGIWGSAFTIHMNRVFEEESPQENTEDELEEEMDLKQCSISDNADSFDEVDADTEGVSGEGQDETDGVKTDMLRFFAEKFSMINSRAGRAAQIPNFMRGLSLQLTGCGAFPEIDSNDQDEMFSDIDGIIAQDAPYMELIDAGLAFNLPFPSLIREHRRVQLILSFECSARDSDNENPLMELAKAKQWADKKGLPFPPIDVDLYKPEEGVKTLYIFKDEDDPHCPIILHFPLTNTSFKDFKAPGVPRETEEEKTFAEFEIFTDSSPYKSSNFQYSGKEFDRLAQLAEYNTLLHVEEMKSIMADLIGRRKQASSDEQSQQSLQRSISSQSKRMSEQ